MTAKQKSLTRQQIEEKITALAWKDDGFRKEFLADPKKQFEERLGKKLPAALKIAAHAEDENNLHFVIPARPTNAGQLSDAELERVAGGIKMKAPRPGEDSLERRLGDIAPAPEINQGWGG